MVIKNVHLLHPSASNRAIRSMVKKPARAPAPPYQQYRSLITALMEAVRCVLGLEARSVLAQHRSATRQAIANPVSKAALRQARIPVVPRHHQAQIPVVPRHHQALISRHHQQASTVLPLRAPTSPLLISATPVISTASDASVIRTSHAPTRPTATATIQTTPQASVRTGRRRMEAPTHRHQIVTRLQILDQRPTLPRHPLQLQTLTPQLEYPQPQTPVTSLPMSLVALPLRRPPT